MFSNFIPCLFKDTTILTVKFQGSSNIRHDGNDGDDNNRVMADDDKYLISPNISPGFSHVTSH
jgi:hypothetical protein